MGLLPVNFLLLLSTIGRDGVMNANIIGVGRQRSVSVLMQICIKLLNVGPLKIFICITG